MSETNPFPGFVCSSASFAYPSIHRGLLSLSLCHDGPPWNKWGPDESWGVCWSSHFPSDECCSSCRLWTVPHGNNFCYIWLNLEETHIVWEVWGSFKEPRSNTDEILLFSRGLILTALWEPQAFQPASLLFLVANRTFLASGITLIHFLKLVTKHSNSFLPLPSELTPSMSVQMVRCSLCPSHPTPSLAPVSHGMPVRSTLSATVRWCALLPLATPHVTFTLVAKAVSKSGTSASQAARAPCPNWTVW